MYGLPVVDDVTWLREKCTMLDGSWDMNEESVNGGSRIRLFCNFIGVMSRRVSENRNSLDRPIVHQEVPRERL